jgi:hypothetical protein
VWLHFLQRLRAIQPSKRRSQDRVPPRYISPTLYQLVDINGLFQVRHNLLDIDAPAGSDGCMKKHPGLDRRKLVRIV